MEKMNACVFHSENDIRVEEVPRPTCGPGDAIIRVTLTTICGTDLHIVRGEYRVKPGLIIGHEPVGVIAELGAGVAGFEIGDRVLVGAITPCGQCLACLSGRWSQCGHGQGYEAMGGWRFGNTINGAQAEFLLVPHAQANLAKIPDELTDEQVVLLADIASTGFSGAESGQVRIGDSVAIFAQGPIGLCATAGARLMGASLIIGIDSDENRLAMSRRMGADVTLTSAPSTSLLKSSGLPAAEQMWRSRPSVNRRRLRMRFGACARAEPCPASACIRESCRCPTTHSRPGSETIA